MEHFYHKIQGWFDFEDLYSEAVAAAADGSNFIEIVSWKGKGSAYMAVEIINSHKNIKFYCVDTWQGSKEHQGFNEVQKDELYDTFLSNMRPVDTRYQAIREKSIDAAKAAEDGLFDFIFLDASHEYADVLADLEHWYPKLKAGGTFAGHDYEPGWPGVVSAVNEFAAKKNLKVDKTSKICFKLVSI